MPHFDPSEFTQKKEGFARNPINHISSNASLSKKGYIDQKLTYTDDGRLIDEDGLSVMMQWEEEIMKKQAQTVAQYGGRVLNVGFGMGYIDSYIQEYNPNEHWIIEPHPDVKRKMIEDGWLKKGNVRAIFSTWQEVIEHLPKFDGIYIDTWDEDVTPFIAYCKHLLKPNGVLSFFNNLSSMKMMGQYDENTRVSPYFTNPIEPWGEITFDSFDIEWISSKYDQTSGTISKNGKQTYYWDPEIKVYHNPSVRIRRDLL